jgi:hypothetical protein
MEKLFFETGEEVVSLFDGIVSLIEHWLEHAVAVTY